MITITIILMMINTMMVSIIVVFKKHSSCDVLDWTLAEEKDHPTKRNKLQKGEIYNLLDLSGLLSEIC